MTGLSPVVLCGKRDAHQVLQQRAVWALLEVLQPECDNLSDIVLRVSYEAQWAGVALLRDVRKLLLAWCFNCAIATLWGADSLQI